jgi:two-component system CheB/CheR fusion protein
VDLEVAFGPGELWLQADPARMTQVVGNLLHNAAKFTPRGGRVGVALGREDGAAVLRVRDSGIGIEASVLGRVFEPFVQADTSLDRRLGGLGLGLALVKALVNLHGGTVEAASEGHNRGATFTVRLPLEPAPASVAEEVARARLAHGRRVLVIEDNGDAAASLRDALELDGHEVIVAHAGPVGIAMARELKPEIVLCDIGLPGMDGFAVARVLREDPALRDVFLVALSGYSLPEDVAKAREDGFDRHLAKPASLERLAEVLAEAPARNSGAEAGHGRERAREILGREP